MKLEARNSLKNNKTQSHRAPPLSAVVRRRRRKMTSRETVKNELSSEGEAKDERSTGGNEEYMEKHGGEVMKSPEGRKKR